MPDPYRHYEGVPVLDLPADPPSPDIPALELLRGARGDTPARDGATFLSQLLFYSAAISASKIVPSTGYRYALRVNPSSGNLHPTEFHFRTRGLAQWPDGQYHYRASSHMAEQRALGPMEIRAPIVFVLTSVVWREAWKYGQRAYRYCLHDIGHAWQALALAAQAMGCETCASGDFPDDALAEQWRFERDEWPMLVISVEGAFLPQVDADQGAPVWYEGQANRLSEREIVYPLIEQFQAATKVRGSAGDCPIPKIVPTEVVETRTFGEVARARRSALDFEGGTKWMSRAQLSAILAAADQPLCADFAGSRFIQLYLYAHRIHGLAAGVYRHWSGGGELELIRAGDQRVAAAALSLRQDLAGNACVAFSMVADLEHAANLHGDRGYRYAHFEAGAVGHRLYLAAEALGLGATGIGAFFDDEVHRYLNLQVGQVIYHFAIGYPVPDTRLSP